MRQRRCKNITMKCYKVTRNISPVLYLFYLSGSFPQCHSYFRTSSFCGPLKWMQSFNSWSGSQFWGFSGCSWKGPFCFRVLELLARVQDRRVICLLPEVRWGIHHLLAPPCFWDAGKAPVEDFQSLWRWLNQPVNGIFSFSLSGFALQQPLIWCASFHPALMKIFVPWFPLAWLKR